ncbi:WD40-repeat-containing domain protein [Umbelopsis sp. PMI_123]|nr:WD40-repeat-containing domain protein [Umbelopsis sp. PMI_123]
MTVGEEPLTGDSPICDFVKPDPRRHVQRITIHHWQLRDLLLCPENKKEVVFPYQNNVIQYNMETEKETFLLKDLTFAPTSITANSGYLAVGGQRSELVVRELHGNWAITTTTGGSINNGVTVAETNGDKRLLVSNNDETIKVFSIPSMHLIDSLCLPTAVNGVTVSPNGRHMVAVGDSNEVFVFNITSSGEYVHTASLCASKDSNFSCSWSHNSDKFAVASQDGTVNVWDMRSTIPLYSLGSKQSPNAKGAARCVKFSTSGAVDLLAYTEHVSYVNIVDARNFSTQQVLRISPSHLDYHITGMSFAPDSRSLLVGLENSVLEYPVDTKARRRFPIGSLL